jgi:hypothetical protein
MRLTKLGLAAIAAFAFDANAQVNGLSALNGPTPPAGMYQQPIVAGSQPDAQAFHAGGVAACDGCHVMHNAQSGVAKSTIAAATSVAPWTNVTNAYLLQGSDQSSTCLICHSGAKQAGIQFTIADLTTATAPTNRTPGGDFGWTQAIYDWTNSPSQRHGHNVAAADFGLGIDPDLTIAPGGTWTGGPGRKQFACSSCHDPHGRYRMQVDAASTNGVAFAGPFPGSVATLPIAASGSYGAEPTATYAVGAYRLLGGQYYVPASNGSAQFPNDPPVAVAPMAYNNTEATSEVRVAYGTGMSEWCQNCHTNIHLDGYTSGVAGLRHPAGSDAVLRGGQIAVYNTYVSSGKVDAAATSKYTSLVPFEQGKSVTLASLKAVAAPDSIIAATGSSNVMCLSCHRAHASGFDSMVRWDQSATFLTDGGAYTNGATGSTTVIYAGGNGARTTAQTQAGYYDRPVGTGTTAIGSYQRSLCNKCHGKD